MALQRFIVLTAGGGPSDDDLRCGLAWLLSRPEADLHIALPTAALRKTFLGKLHKWRPEIGTPLKTHGVVRFKNATLTISIARPDFQARANGACLLLWGNSGEAEQVEKRLGSVGAIYVVPFSTTSNTWKTANDPIELNCRALMASDDPQGAAATQT